MSTQTSFIGHPLMGVTYEAWYGDGDAKPSRTYNHFQHFQKKSLGERELFIYDFPWWETAPAGFYPFDWDNKQCQSPDRAVVVVEWLTHSGRDRLVRTVRPFAFKDFSGNIWSVPAGTVSDGASIPRVLWWLIGHPLMGDYRRGAVVHDYACEVLTSMRRVGDALLDREVLPDHYYDPRLVHRMLYDACTVDSLTSWKRWAIWRACDKFGPQGETRRK